MTSLTYQFSLLSATFAHGAYQSQNLNTPEIRPPSIKGMIRWWHKALGFSTEDADEIFGSISPVTQASRITIRLSPPDSNTHIDSSFMPHKGHRGGFKQAIPPGISYTLTLSSRRGPLSAKLSEQLQKATEAWLLLGSIGQRSNRAAGSILWDKAPTDPTDFRRLSSNLLKGSQIRCAILPKDFDQDEESARGIAGDFLADKAFGGAAPFGSARPRKPSPLKLKCLQLAGSLYLLAIWDRRGESPHNLEHAVRMLSESEKEIGTLLSEVLPELTR